MNEIYEIVFDEITEDMIQKIAIRTKGAAGPSKFDADDWRRILGTNAFDNHSLELRRSFIRMAKRLCPQKLSRHKSLEALIASQLIPLNKWDVRPVGIVEVLRRIIGETVMSVVKKEIIQAAGSLQVCACQVAGVESAIHSMLTYSRAITLLQYSRLMLRMLLTFSCIM